MKREKDNKTLKDALRKVSNEHCDDWDMFIDEVLFAHRILQSMLPRV